MDDRFQDILDGIPEKPPRSSLEPYRELINELRQRGRTYRDIAHILAEKCQLRAAASTVYRFLSKRNVVRAESPMRRIPRPATAITRAATKTIPQERLPDNEVRQRLAALKLKPAPARSSPELFRYDPNEPLQLPTKDRRANSG
jgi:hypothetical protein